MVKDERMRENSLLIEERQRAEGFYGIVTPDSDARDR